VTPSRDLPACSIVPQPTTLPRAPFHICTYAYYLHIHIEFFKPLIIIDLHNKNVLHLSHLHSVVYVDTFGNSEIFAMRGLHKGPYQFTRLSVHALHLWN
jgi:hypothetical protein